MEPTADATPLPDDLELYVSLVSDELKPVGCMSHCYSCYAVALVHGDCHLTIQPYRLGSTCVLRDLWGHAVRSRDYWGRSR
jgi:hypothetical protein